MLRHEWVDSICICLGYMLFYLFVYRFLFGHLDMRITLSHIGCMTLIRKKKETCQAFSLKHLYQFLF
jgi:hypothetical protein